MGQKDGHEQDGFSFNKKADKKKKTHQAWIIADGLEKRNSKRRKHNYVEYKNHSTI